MEPTLNTDLSTFVRQMCGENVYLCYQCERCSLDCPTALAMRFRPAQMMRAAQFGLDDLLATDASLWRCLGCDSCTQHCPHGVSVRRLVEAMRQKVMQERYRVHGEKLLGDDQALHTGLRALGMVGARIESYHNVSGEDNANRLAWTENLEQKPASLVQDRTAEMAHFVGCVSAMFPMTYPIPQAFTAILGRAVVTYHDPCDLGRKGGLYDAPRRVLSAIADCEFVEMVQNREHALCCGGDIETFDPSALEDVSSRRIAQAAETGAGYLVSACPQCVRTLQKAAKASKAHLRVVDIAQFVESCLG